MDTRYYHGEITPHQVAQALIAHFHKGNLNVLQVGNDDEIVVHISSMDQPKSGGQTAIAVSLNKTSDGIAVQIGKQSWLGVAASLGQTAFIAWRNPLGLLSRLDDIAQDIENLQITDQISQVIETAVHTAGASFKLSERLRRMVCLYCDTANLVGESSCIACGAPLGPIQPTTCKNCGFIITSTDQICPNCNQPIS
jgi:hypothetical protein